MRKALLMVVALSSLLWSGGLWVGDHAHQIALLLLIGGVFLYGVAFVLFCVRFFQWLRVLKKQKIDLSGFNFFRRIEAIRPYQREARLQAVVYLLIPGVGYPLSFFQPDLDATIALSICLVWPFSLLLYAILCKEFDQIAKAVPS